MRAFLLVEAPGPWGVDALRATMLPEPVRQWLRRLEPRHHVRPLLIRHGGRRRTDVDHLNVFAGHAGPQHPWLEHTRIDDYEELLDLDLAGMATGRRPGLTPYDEPLFCVCTHGRHDACCAERGRPVWEAMRREDREHAWQVSHIGGDRYAGNVLVLPHGLYYGRMSAPDAAALVAADRRGELLLDRLRGRSTYPFAVQAAEVALRRHTGVLGLDDVRLVEHTRTGRATEAVFEVGGKRHRVQVHTSAGPPRALTCSASVLSPPLAHRVVGID